MHAAEIFWMYVLDKAFSYYKTIWDCFKCTNIAIFITQLLQADLRRAVRTYIRGHCLPKSS